MRAVVLVLPVALLCVLAGCNAFPGADGPSDPATSVDVPEDRPEDYAFPPGVAEHGSVDTDRLIRAHREETADVSHTMTYHVVVERGSGENRTTTLDWNQTVWYENESVYRSAVSYESIDRAAQAAQTNVYANGSVEFSRSVRATERLYLSGMPSDRPPATELVAAAIGRYLPSKNASVERVVRDRQGYTVIRADSFGRNTSTITNESVEALVRPSGFVQELTVTYTEQASGVDRRSNVTVHVEYSALGETTATPPDWLPEAREEIDRTPPVVITEFVVTTNARPDANATTTSTPTPASTPETPTGDE